MTFDVKSPKSNHSAAVDGDVGVVARTSSAAGVAVAGVVVVVAGGDVSERWHCL